MKRTEKVYLNSRVANFVQRTKQYSTNTSNSLRSIKSTFMYAVILHASNMTALAVT